MKRFIVNETFTDEDTGTEYAQGAIYSPDSDLGGKVQQWFADGKVRDADELTPGEAAEAAKHTENETDENGDDDDLTPEEIDEEIDQEDAEDEDEAAELADKAKAKRRKADDPDDAA